MGFRFDQLALKEVFNSTSDGVFILDKEWKIVAMNPAAEEMSGWNRSEVELMRLCTEVFLCFDNEGNQLCDNGCPKQSVMKTGQMRDSLDIKIMPKSGHAVILPGACVILPAAQDESCVAIMIRDEKERQMLEERLLAGERLDPLTHLYHRQYFEELYSIEAKRAQRHGGLITLLMLDVDKLRDINKELGSRAGDEILKGIGRVIRETIRDVDVAARYGEDEYIILLYGVDEVRAQSFIQRLRKNIQKWRQGRKLSLDVKMNMGLMVSDRDFEVLPQRLKVIIEDHKGITL